MMARTIVSAAPSRSVDKPYRLEPVAIDGDPRRLASHFLGQDFLENVNIIVLITGVFERSLRKYGPRGYRYMLLEAGHVAQNLCLGAADVGLGALCLGGFRDASLNRFLGLDGQREAVLYCVSVGTAAAAAGGAER
jgi:SagB-type dehydrogenase family enzyme